MQNSDVIAESTTRSYKRLILNNQKGLLVIDLRFFSAVMESKQHTFVHSFMPALAALTIGSVTVFAETETMGLTELDPYYVTVSTRTPLSPERTSPSVSYISADEMTNWQDRGLFDVLSRDSGLALARNGSIGSVGSLFIRGTESRHTAVLLDGRRLNPGLANQFDLENVSVDNLDNVQLMKGASSVSYGSSGIGGVVDMRMRNAFDTENANQVTAELGSNNYRRGSGSIVWSEGAFATSLEVSDLSTDNERVNDDFKSRSMTQRADYKITDKLTLEFVGRYTQSEKENPGSLINPSTFAYGDTTNWLLSPGIRYSSDELSMHLFYARSDFEFEGVNDFGGPFPFLSTVESDEISFQADISLSDEVLLTTGLNYRKDVPRSSNNPAFNAEFEQLGAFMQLIALVSDSLELRAGIRADDFSEYEDPVTGSLEAIYTLESMDTTLFAKVANSFSPPTGQDLIFDQDPATPVNAEESISYEFGLRKTFEQQALEIEMVYFRNEIDDLIDFVFDPILFVSDGFNVDEALTEGVEAAFTYDVTDRLSLNGSYTYLTAVDTNTDARLEKRPRHTIQAGIDLFLTDAIRIGANATSYVDRVGFGGATLDDFVVANLVASWSLNEDLVVFARVENTFDKDYELSAGYPSLGRAGYIGARFNF